MKKILVINGSPRGKNGNTQFIIRHFLEGCEKEGAQTETIYLKDKNIHSCRGCFTCWIKTPGKCAIKDDMEELIEKVNNSDVVVYATPLYYYTFSGIMKNFIDRLLPRCRGELVKTENGSYSHDLRKTDKAPIKSVLISNCGFPGRNNFKALSETFKLWHRNSDNIAGNILISQGGLLAEIDHNEMLTKIYTPLINALQSAGAQVVKNGCIDKNTQELLDKQYISDDIYVQNANQNWAD